MIENCEPMIDLASVVFDHGDHHFEYVESVYNLYACCLADENRVWYVMLAWFLLFCFQVNRNVLHIITIILKQKNQIRIKNNKDGSVHGHSSSKNER